MSSATQPARPIAAYEAPAAPVAAGRPRAADDAHMPQLDGLRCFAALIVIAHHTVLARTLDVGVNGVGVYGVWLFFVLSGFLITGILLRAQRDAEYRRGPLLRAFYARRSLRIFPLYYAVVAICAVAGIGTTFRQHGVWFFAYAGNWYMASVGHWADRVATPTWSLGVEEQFYLVWPTLVLFAPRRLLPRLLVATAMLGVASRVAIALLWPGASAAVRAIVPTTSNLDPLALGALLAWHSIERPRDVAVRDRWARRALALGAALGAVVVALTVAHRGERAMLAVETLAAGLVSVWLVNAAASGFAPRSIGGLLLGARPVRYVGTISYGVYLLHAVMIWLLRQRLAPELARRTDVVGAVSFFVVVTAMTIGAASVSWFAFERPLNSLKRRFPYVRRTRREAAGGAGAERTSAAAAPASTALG
jgi:peptidoglycan/LPS O-acetylase OafA/YrhL